MLGYILAHWRGQLTLAVSYWVNGVLLNLIVVGVLAMVGGVFAAPFARPSWTDVLGLVAFGIVGTGFGLWQLVGIWRSAGRHMRETQRRFWAVIARGVVALNFLGLAGEVYSYGSIVRLQSQLVTGRLMGDYSVSLMDGSEIRLQGDISFGAIDEVQQLLDDNPGVEALTLDSAGGLVGAAFELVALVEERELAVIATGECISACTMPLLASPRPVAAVGTVIGFHRWSSFVANDREAGRTMAAEYLRFLNAHGVDEAISRRILDAGPSDLWTPSFRVLISQRIIRQVFDPDRREYVGAEVWCAANADACDAEPNQRRR